MIQYKCPNCGTAMSSPDSLVGGFETCLSCAASVRVPQKDGEQPQDYVMPEDEPIGSRRSRQSTTFPAWESRHLPPAPTRSAFLVLLWIVGGLILIVAFIEIVYGSILLGVEPNLEREIKGRIHFARGFGGILAGLMWLALIFVAQELRYIRAELHWQNRRKGD